MPTTFNVRVIYGICLGSTERVERDHKMTAEEWLDGHVKRSKRVFLRHARVFSSGSDGSLTWYVGVEVLVLEDVAHASTTGWPIPLDLTDALESKQRAAVDELEEILQETPHLWLIAEVM
jgi:hypothetical protein